MELRQFRYFLAVVEEGNLTRAAEAVAIRPTSLSQQIIALERELGTALFIRTPSGMTLSPAGARLLPHARVTVESARRARESTQQRHGLNLAVTPGAPPWLAPALWRVAGPSLQIAEAQTAEQLSQLRAAVLDAGVLLLPADLAGLRHVVLEDAELGVVVATEHRLASRCSVSWADLAGNALLWFARSSAPGYHDAVQEAWLRAGWHPTEIRVRPPRRSLLRAELAQGGPAVALRPAWDVQPGDGTVWLPFTAEAPCIQYALVWNASDSATSGFQRMAADLTRTA